ncbi:MAG: hypothetical protein WAR79_09950 [Melioribacteraceae bacterium]
MKNLLLFSFLLVINVFSQVKNDDSMFNYYPLKVGNSWLFTSPSNGFSQETLVKSSSNEKYLVITKSFLGNLSPITKTEILLLRNNMLLITASANDSFGNEMEEYFEKPIILKFPLSLKQTWKYDLKGKKYKAKVIKKHNSIETPYGTFNDVVEIHIQVNDDGFIANKFEFYAFKIGLVKTETSDSEHGERRPFLYLEKYTLN